jgi:hypothetical protein
MCPGVGVGPRHHFSRAGVVERVLGDDGEHTLFVPASVEDYVACVGQGGRDGVDHLAGGLGDAGSRLQHVAAQREDEALRLPGGCSFRSWRRARGSCLLRPRCCGLATKSRSPRIPRAQMFPDTRWSICGCWPRSKIGGRTAAIETRPAGAGRSGSSWAAAEGRPVRSSTRRSSARFPNDRAGARARRAGRRSACSGDSREKACEAGERPLAQGPGRGTLKLRTRRTGIGRLRPHEPGLARGVEIASAWSAMAS